MASIAYSRGCAHQKHTWDTGDGPQCSVKPAIALNMETRCLERGRKRMEEPPVFEPARPLPRRRRKAQIDKQTVSWTRWPDLSQLPLRLHSMNVMTMLLLTILAIFSPCAHAVFLDVENCLPASTTNAEVKYLQFTPLFLSAHFDTSSPNHSLNVTIYGNVSGQTTSDPYPDADDPSWTNPESTYGKIVNYTTTNMVERYTTLMTSVRVLTYTPYSGRIAFCEAVLNGTCPLGPSFHANRYDPYAFSTFSIAKDFNSSYAFSTFATTMIILSGDETAVTLGCISARITPQLGAPLSNMLRYVPAAILALVAVATIAAAILSPWGTSDPFRWTSNYGRDEDLLRLVTPGFGDCLQYIQFIVLSGSLNLDYPGYYQPVVSRASWSTLLFNESFVSHGDGYPAVVDGVYSVNGTYGMSTMGQNIGLTTDEDVWACMAVFLAGLTLGVIILCQLGFAIRWSYRALSNDPDQDLRSKNWPFTVGNIVRLFFSYFLLPIVALSMYQMVVASTSPASVVALAVLLIAGILGFATWIFRLIFSTRPRAHLFDDLPTVLLYGPLYNTYSDEAAPFAFVPILLTFVRGVAIGAVQPSGIAQLVILAICEVIMILSLHAFRPFQTNTSMNAYHTFFSIIRLIATLLSVAFVPSLNVIEGSKGWIGYIILLLHAIVLIFGFFLNALQTLIEVFARLAGAGDARGGLTKVFGMRQLSRRGHRRQQRSSLNSQAAILGHENDRKSAHLMDGGRSRSMSASSGVLLHSQGTRMSGAFDQFSQGGDYSVGGMSSGTGTPGGAASPLTLLPGSSSSSRRPTMGLKAADPVDPYYRPPRMKKPTMEPVLPGAKSRRSWLGGSTSLKPYKPYKDSPEHDDADDFGEGPAFASNRGSITPAYLRAQRDDSDLNLPERRNNTDYAVREADFYYGVSRGPALSNLPTRRLKTGPADPMGPVASATSWFKGLGFFTGKSREKGKGFEVIRSTRAPPQMMPLEDVEAASPPLDTEPYRDNPTEEPSDRPETAALQREQTRTTIKSNSDDDDDEFTDDETDPFELRLHRVSDQPPALGPIESVGGIDLPSRVGSQVSHKPARGQSTKSVTPGIPRKSSRRTRSKDSSGTGDHTRLSTVVASSTNTARNSLLGGGIPEYQHDNALHVRMPFTSDPSPSPERSAGASVASSIYPAGDGSGDPSHRGTRSGSERPMSTGYVQQHVAGEQIHPSLYDVDTYLGTEAELVDIGTSRSRSTDRSN